MAETRVAFAGSEAETGALAGRVAAALRPGDVLTLSGDLGAGKTTFTRFLVAALGSPAPVSSPTFTLLHEYEGGRLPVYHMDAYRLGGGARDAYDTGLDDYLRRGDGVVVVEWPEMLGGALPPERLEIRLEEEDRDGGGEARRVTLTGRGPRWEAGGVVPC